MESPALSRRLAWTVALVATLTMTVSYIDRATLAVLAPSVTKALGISDTAYGWLTSAFSIAYLVATPLSGWWIDRVGARRGLLGSLLLWTSIAALHALVPGFATLFILRIALGIAEGPSFPGAAQTLQRVLPPDERARGFGVLFTGSSIGGMLVPPLASWLFGLGGWPLAFVGTAAVGLLWVPLWLLVTRRADVRARMDTPPAAEDVVPRASFRDLASHPILLRGLCAIFAAAPIAGFALGWGAKFLDRTFRVAQEDVGHYLWLPPLMFDAGAILFGDLASRLRRAPGAPPRLLFAIAFILGTALALLPLATTPWQAMAFLGIAMIGAGAMYTLATADLLSRVPARNVSLAGGMMAGSQSLALIIMNPLIGASVDHAGDYHAVTIALGIWVIPGSLVWLAWRPPSYARA
ncbi:MAG: MFS transporter [Deltaproteobacteria bacterium]|nr:MFS transporter [Deltaproteobacteria bacterium]MDQ3300963.1 MFS transporter [Myxococcota bacterium]